MSSNNSSTATRNTIVGVRYRVGKKVGEGSFGVVFEGIDLSNSTTVAIKFEPRKADVPQLLDEFRSYRILAGCPGVPQLYHFGQEGLHNMLVIELLGPSLEDLFDMCGRKFSIKTVCMIARQMLSRVQTIHEKNLIYRDITPDNFLIGRPGTKSVNLIHVVDFGMAKQYRDPRTQQHIPYREGRSFNDTARYMSINTHLGREQSRRDDLEALGHVFMYFLRGGLPWQGLRAATNKQKYEKIGEKKQTTPIKDLCEGYPEEFGIYLNYVRKFGFEETPDYNFLRELFSKVMKNNNDIDDDNFDWNLLNGGKGWEASRGQAQVLAQMQNTDPEELLSVLDNVTDIKSILDSDATRRPKKAAVPVPRSIPRSIPPGFFDEVRDDINSSTIPANPPPATTCTTPLPSTAHSGPPASTTQADYPPSTHSRRNILAYFSVSGARALLARVSPRFPRRNTNLSTDLQQHSSQPLVSVHEPANAEVPAMKDNQSDATPRLAQDGDSQIPPQNLLADAQDRIQVRPQHLNGCFLQALPQLSTTRTHPPSSEYHRRHTIGPSSRSSARPLLGRISERFHGSQPNTNESTELQEYPAQRVISHHKPAIVEVSEAHDKQALYVV